MVTTSICFENVKVICCC